MWDVVTAQSRLSIDLLGEDSEQLTLNHLFLLLFPPFISSSQPTSFPAFVFPVLFLIPLGKRRNKQEAVWGFTASCGQYNTEFKNKLDPAWREISSSFLCQFCIFKHIVCQICYKLHADMRSHSPQSLSITRNCRVKSDHTMHVLHHQTQCVGSGVGRCLKMTLSRGSG